MARPVIDLRALSVQERLELLEDIWTSLTTDEQQALPLTAEQTVELNRRLDRLDRDGPSGVTPNELRERVKASCAR